MPEERIRQLEAENSRLREAAATHAADTPTALAAHDLRAILDHMPAMIGYWDKEQRNRFGNHAYLEWFGIDPATLPGKHIREVIGEERYRLNLPYIEGALRGEPQEFERAIPTPDGKGMRYSLAHYIPDLVNGEVRGFYVLVSDITAVKDAEAALRASEERYRAVVEDQTEMICRIRQDGTFLFANEVYCRFFGQTAAALIDQKWMPVCYPEDLPLVVARLETLAPQNPVVVIENRVYAGDGRLHWMQFVNRGFFDAAGRLTEIQSVGRDITERKQAETILQAVLAELEQRVHERTEELQRLAIQTTLVEERERQAIARDLHDDLGQRLHIVLLKLDALAKNCPAAAERTNELRGELAAASAVVRSLTAQLSPTILHDLGLIPALRWLGDEMARLYELEVEIRTDVPHVAGLPAAQSAILFRAARELLINVARHARTAHALLTLNETAGRLVLSVEDAGIGLQGAAPGFGLSSVRERLAYLGGMLEFGSPPHGGTRVVLSLPLPQPPIPAQEPPQ